jgi:hypothetical protein
MHPQQRKSSRFFARTSGALCCAAVAAMLGMCISLPERRKSVNRYVFEFLHDSVLAFLMGTAAPSLLPDTS